jgi:hypothetical protein
MAKKIETRINIQASVHKVWHVLTQTAEYPSWNPFITSIEGELAQGKRIKVVIAPPDTKSMSFSPVIKSFQINKEWSWLGSLWVRGLFDGLHRFELQSNPDGSTTLIHEEQFDGILVRFINLDNTARGFKAMNEAIKLRAEAIG